MVLSSKVTSLNISEKRGNSGSGPSILKNEKEQRDVPFFYSGQRAVRESHGRSLLNDYI